jgi:hypothetical protein
MTFEFIFIPDQYVVFVILALFFFIVFFVYYFPLTLSSSLPYLFTHLLLDSWIRQLESDVRNYIAMLQSIQTYLESDVRN